MTGFWDGAGGAILGSFLAGVVAVATLFLTRRHDRALLREQVGLDAATRLLEEGLPIATLLEVEQVGLPGGPTYDEWLEALLSATQRFRYRAVMDAPLLPSRAMRHLVTSLAHWCARGLIDRIGFTEGAAIEAGEDWLPLLALLQQDEHEDVGQALGYLSRWRIDGLDGHEVTTFARYLDRKDQEQARGPIPL